MNNLIGRIDMLASTILNLDKIFRIESLDELVNYMKTQGPDEIRKALLEAFRLLYHYQNAEQWNQLVRVCESLAIVGWDTEQPKQASTYVWFNGSYYTELQTLLFESENTRRWCKYKETFVIDDGEDKTNYGVRKLNSQRNPLPRNPIRFVQGIANRQQSLDAFVEALSSLRSQLDQQMRPDLYGTDFGYIGLSLAFSNHDDIHYSVRSEYYHDETDVPTNLACKYYICPRLKIGKLSSKEGELRLLCSRYFTKAFGYLSLQQQKEEFKSDLLEVVNHLALKLAKRKSNYKVDLLREDLVSILASW